MTTDQTRRRLDDAIAQALNIVARHTDFYAPLTTPTYDAETGDFASIAEWLTEIELDFDSKELQAREDLWTAFNILSNSLTARQDPTGPWNVEGAFTMIANELSFLTKRGYIHA